MMKEVQSKVSVSEIAGSLTCFLLPGRGFYLCTGV